MSTNNISSKKEKTYSNKELISLYQSSKDINIRNEIIINNLGLIYIAAKKKLKISNSYTFEDLVQEGIIGMIKGIEKFDITKNTSFSTYVYYWIVQQMDRAIMNNGFMIRLPAYMYEKINNIHTTENDYISKNLKIDINTLCDDLNITKKEYLIINFYKKNHSHLTSLNAIINLDSDENYITILDYIPSLDISIEDIIIFKSLKDELNKTLNKLSPREKKILELRFGLNGNEPLTLEAIGNIYDLTRERIRQIQNTALNKIKKLNSRNGLKDFLADY